MKLVCYNIHRGTDEFNRITFFQLIGYLKSLDSDIICMQEVLYHQFLLMKTLLNMNGEFGLHVNNKKVKYGICILTKVKIIEKTHLLLSSKTEQRGMLCVNIDGNTIVNTHLGLEERERQNQINEILDFLDNQNNKIIICGDFNQKNIYLDSYKDSARFFSKDFCPTFKKSRIDYIFIRGNINIKSYKVDEVFYSDHYPIMIEI